MAFDLDTYHEFVRLLYQHPELRAEVRQLVLSEEILALPRVVQELAEAQKRTDEQLWILTQRVDELAEAQKRTEQRVEELAEAQKRTDEQLRVLTQRVDALTQRMDELTQRVDALTQRMDELTQRVDALTQRVDALTQRMDELTQRVDALTQRVDALTQRMDELTQRVDALTQRMEELAEAQKRTEQRVEELAEAQKRSEERLTRLEQAVAELAEAQKRTEQRVEELAEAQKRTEERIQDLAERQKRLEERVGTLTTRVGEVSGYMLETRYRQRPLAYLGRLLAQAEVVDLPEAIPAENDLTEDELQELLALDVLIRGRLRPAFAEQVGFSELWLAVELSGQIEYNDVERAWERAELLKRCGFWPVVGVVGGKEITENAARAANRKKKVLVELDRRLVNLEGILHHLKAGSGHEAG